MDHSNISECVQHITHCMQEYKLNSPLLWTLLYYMVDIFSALFGDGDLLPNAL